MLTVLIAEDDPAMRQVIKRVVEETGDVRVVGEAADGAEALKLFENLQPNVVFIDVDLPVKDGVLLAREVFERNSLANLVFITAYDQFREEAFEVYACDYIVKPFKLERLRQTIERIRLRTAESAAGQAVSGQSRHLEVPKEDLRLFRTRSRLVMLRLKDIIYITREGRRTVIYHIGGRLETKENLDSLERELSKYPFLRTHKGFIVNLSMVEEIMPLGRTYELAMAHTPKRALITAKKLREVQEYLGAKKLTRLS